MGKVLMILRNFGILNLFMHVLIVYVFCFNMEMTHGRVGGSRYGSGLGIGTKPIDEGLHEFTASEITIVIIDVALMMFEMIKEGIIKLMEERSHDFRAELDAWKCGAHTLLLGFQGMWGTGVPWGERTNCR